MDLSRWHPPSVIPIERKIVVSWEDRPKCAYCTRCLVFSYSSYFIPYLQHLLFLLLKLRSSMYLGGSLPEFVQFCASAFAPVLTVILGLWGFLKPLLEESSRSIKQTKDEVHIVYQSYIIKLITSYRLILSKPSSAPK